MAAFRLDDYVSDVLLRDLVGHDRSCAAFVVYLFDFWVEVSSPGEVYYCGTDGTSVDYSNYAGAQIDGISRKANAKGEADVHWTLTYPQ